MHKQNIKKLDDQISKLEAGLKNEKVKANWPTFEKYLKKLKAERDALMKPQKEVKQSSSKIKKVSPTAKPSTAKSVSKPIAQKGDIVTPTKAADIKRFGEKGKVVKVNPLKSGEFSYTVKFDAGTKNFQAEDISTSKPLAKDAKKKKSNESVTKVKSKKAKLDLKASNLKDMHFDKWIELFKPIKNTITGREEYNGFMFETFGKDFDFIKETSKDNPLLVWRVVEEDDGFVICSGYDENIYPFCYFVTKVESPSSKFKFYMDTTEERIQMLEEESEAYDKEKDKQAIELNDKLIAKLKRQIGKRDGGENQPTTKTKLESPIFEKVNIWGDGEYDMFDFKFEASHGIEEKETGKNNKTYDLYFEKFFNKEYPKYELLSFDLDELEEEEGVLNYVAKTKQIVALKSTKKEPKPVPVFSYRKKADVSVIKKANPIQFCENFKVVKVDQPMEVDLKVKVSKGEYLVLNDDGYPFTVLTENSYKKRCKPVKDTPKNNAKSSSKANPNPKVAIKKKDPASPKVNKTKKKSQCAMKRNFNGDLPAPIRAWYDGYIEKWHAKEAHHKVYQMYFHKPTKKFVVELKHYSPLLRRHFGTFSYHWICLQTGRLTAMSSEPKSNDLKKVSTIAAIKKDYSSNRNWSDCSGWIKEAYKLAQSGDNPDRKKELYQKFYKQCGDLTAKKEDIKYIKWLHKKTREYQKKDEGYWKAFKRVYNEMKDKYSG